MIGYPSIKGFIAMVDKNMLMNCPIASDDIRNAEKIFGPDIHFIQGKNTRQQPFTVRTDYVQVPRTIIELNKEVILTKDIIFVNNLPFFVRISGSICFVPVEYITYHKKIVILNAIKIFIGTYNKRVFNIQTVLVNP